MASHQASSHRLRQNGRRAVDAHSVGAAGFENLRRGAFDRRRLEFIYTVSWIASPDKLDSAFVPDIILIAVKPQNMAEVLPIYARFNKALFVSIAAGITLERLQRLLGDAQVIVRVMPNLPASVGKGVSVAIANKNVSTAQRALADNFLKTVGEMACTKDENLLDAVTALSGNGPAYVFALCEAMQAAGEKMGLPADLASKLAHGTIIGSGALLAQSSETNEALLSAVNSPGGTTEAALSNT